MRMQVTLVVGRPEKAAEVASDLNESVGFVPAGHPDRVYVAERTRVPFVYRIVKYTESLTEAER